MRAAVLAIGDEILSGATLDTNSAFLAESLRSAGVEVVSLLGAPDDAELIVRALERGLADAELVVTTGGLGPTADDLTTAAVARVAGRELELHQPSLERIRERFSSRGLEMSPNNRKQAMLPSGCDVLENPTGTAPGFVCEAAGASGSRWIASLPGVPHEMRIIVEQALLPWLRRRTGGRRFETRVFSTFGLAESRLDELLDGVVAPEEARLAFRAAFPRVQARITVSGRVDEDLDARLDDLERRIRPRLGDHLYAVGDVGMEEVVGELLRDRRLSLAVAESCTGGRIGDRLTEVAGSSSYFRGGVVAYDNALKREMLGVRAATLARHGAVSEPVAEEMAAGVRVRAEADLGLATTGIAGPSGGTPEKPVGTVCIALAWEGGTWSRRYQLGERGRGWIKEMTAQVALDRLRRWLVERQA